MHELLRGTAGKASVTDLPGIGPGKKLRAVHLDSLTGGQGKRSEEHTSELQSQR